MKLLLESDIT